MTNYRVVCIDEKSGKTLSHIKVKKLKDIMNYTFLEMNEIMDIFKEKIIHPNYRICRIETYEEEMERLQKEYEKKKLKSKNIKLLNKYF
jgi:hypothetical protein